MFTCDDIIFQHLTVGAVIGAPVNAATAPDAAMDVSPDCADTGGLSEADHHSDVAPDAMLTSQRAPSITIDASSDVPSDDVLAPIHSCLPAVDQSCDAEFTSQSATISAAGESLPDMAPAAVSDTIENIETPNDVTGAASAPHSVVDSVEPEVPEQADTVIITASVGTETVIIPNDTHSVHQEAVVHDVVGSVDPDRAAEITALQETVQSLAPPASTQAWADDAAATDGAQPAVKSKFAAVTRIVSICVGNLLLL